jgi:MoxR-like ATPase
MFMVKVAYPQREEELEILRRTTGALAGQVRPVFKAEELLSLQEVVRKVPAGDHVCAFAVDLARATRVSESCAAPEAKRWLEWGAGPRASQYLLLGAKARALLRGRFHATVEDIRALALPVLRHRLVLSFAAESEGLTTDMLIEKLLAQTQARSSPAKAGE